MVDKPNFLIALAQEQHFARAAEHGVTQSRLSSGIKQFGDTLGVLLVQRGSRFNVDHKCRSQICMTRFPDRDKP
jgi:regulatory helix-turn-helix LysR family protein